MSLNQEQEKLASIVMKELTPVLTELYVHIMPRKLTITEFKIMISRDMALICSLITNGNLILKHRKEGEPYVNIGAFQAKDSKETSEASSKENQDEA